MKVLPLPADSIYRIETTKGKLLEFQQSKEGPDYQSLARVDVTQANDAELAQATAIRFAPEQIVHIRIGDDRKTFYPYGVSIIEPARGPAHQLRLMEDAMVVYRLTRAPERRVFYIDVGNLPKGKAEQYVSTMMNKFKNKLSYDAITGDVVDSKRHLSMMEDFWMPRRDGGKGTEITTLPGGQGLGQLDDLDYFLNKLYHSLNVPISRTKPDTGFSIGKSDTVSRDEIKFNKFINKIRSRFNGTLLDPLRVQLVAKGIISNED